MQKCRFFAGVLLSIVMLALAGCGGGGGAGGGGTSVAAPSAPAGLSVTTGDGVATISWTPVTGATSYNIYWSTTPGQSTSGTKISTPDTSNVLTGLTDWTTYYFVVTAVGAGGESAISSQIGAAPGVTVTAGDGQALLAWPTVTGANSYTVSQSTAGSGVSPVVITTDSVGWLLSSLVNGTTYHVVVTALSAAGESLATASVDVKTSVAPSIQALVLSLGSGSNPLGWLQQVIVFTDALQTTLVTDATVTVNGTPLIYNPAVKHYRGSVAIAPGTPVTVSVTTGGVTYTASGTQFTTFPTVTTPSSGATWNLAQDNTAAWTAGAPSTEADYLVGMVGSTGLISRPTDNPTSVNSITFSAGTLTAGSYQLLVGIGTPGIGASTDGIQFSPVTATGSGLWIGGISAFVPITVQ